jgi:hypothetical protein
LTVKGTVSPYIEQFENNVVILEKENHVDRDHKKSTIMILTSAENGTSVDSNNRDIEIKNNGHHRPSANNKVQNGSSPAVQSPQQASEVVINSKRPQQQQQQQQQQQPSPSKDKPTPRREPGQAHRSPATPANKSDLNIVSLNWNSFL